MRFLPLCVGAALAVAHPAEAGPWCVEPLVIAPRPGNVLPPRPELLLFRERARFGGKPLPEEPRLQVHASINGKAVPVTLRRERQGGYDLTFVKVHSKRRGTLALRAAHRCPAPRGTANEEIEVVDFPTCFESSLLARYTIGEPPQLSPEAGEVAVQYETRIGLTRDDYYFFFGVPVSVPALLFEVRWRRDERAEWRSFVTPAHPVLGEARAEGLDTAEVAEHGESEPEGPRRAEVRIGEQRCHAPDIPLPLMQLGFQVEVVARLADGRAVPLAGVPRNLTYPATEQTLARERRSEGDR